MFSARSSWLASPWWAFWDWDWFIPILDRQASAAIGRKTTVQHLHVALGRTTLVTMDGVQIASADGYPAGKPFATADKLTAAIDVMAYIHTRQIVITADHRGQASDRRRGEREG